tara:strand:- start:483 stop:1475 length:993 start_codon:yes stop_codon:yes gene_type:complete
MGNKGQITMFIVLGILLLFIAGFFIILNRPSDLDAEKTSEIPSDIRPIYNYIEECIKDIALNGISILSAQGGHIFEKGKLLETSYSNISYGYYERKDILPSISSMQKDISQFIDLALPDCTDFSLFPGFNITSGIINTTTQIIDDEVIFEVDYDLKVNFNDKIANPDKFQYKAPIRLGHNYKIAKNIIKKTLEEPEWVDMTFLSGFDVKIDILPHDEDEFVYSITDEKSIVDNKEYIFLFANKFIVNKKPVLNIPDTLKFKDAKPVVFRLDATDPEDDILTFSDDSPMFDITDDGVILFIPEVPGEYDVTITVEDTHNNRVSKQVKFIIE